MATTIEKLILAIETQKFDEAERQLQKLRKSVEGAGNATERAGKQADGASNAYRKFKGPTSALTTTTGQLSVQLQDVAVQAQMGTDAVRIFAQQGPQIASIFGPTGAVYGALIAVGAIIIGPFVKSWMAASKVIEETKKELNEFNEEMQNLSEADKAAKKFLLVEAMRNQRDEITKLTKEFQDAIEKQGKFGNGAKDFETIFYQLSKGVISYEEALHQSSGEILITRAALERTKKSLSENENLYNILNGTVEENTKKRRANNDAVLSTLDSLRLQVKEIELGAIGAELFRLELLGANDAQLAAAKGALEAVEAYKKAVQAEKDATKAAKEAATVKKREAKEAMDAAIAAMRQEYQERKLIRELEELMADEASKAAKKRTDEAIDNAKREYEEFMLFLDLMELRRQDELKREKEVASARRNLEREGLLQSQEDLMGFHAFREKMLKDELANKTISEKEYHDGIKRLNEMGRDIAIASAGDALNALGRYNKDAFEMAKAYNSAKAIMDTYTAANNALANIPPPWNFIAAGAAIAMGLANLAQIQSQTYQGRALGGQVRAGESYVVGERGPELLTMGGSGRITPNEKLNSGSQQPVTNVANVSFTIQANDTAGFDDLLLSRRGQIVGIINEALNDQGRRAIA
jgi:hypothetical protein